MEATKSSITQMGRNIAVVFAEHQTEYRVQIEDIFGAMMELGDRFGEMHESLEGTREGVNQCGKNDQVLQGDMLAI